MHTDPSLSTWRGNRWEGQKEGQREGRGGKESEEGRWSVGGRVTKGGGEREGCGREGCEGGEARYEGKMRVYMCMYYTIAARPGFIL